MPAQRTHGKTVVVPLVVKLQLLAEILKGIEPVGGIEPLVVFPVAALHFPIVPWRKRADQLVPDPQLFQTHLKNGRLIRTAIRGKTFCKLLSVVRLHALYGARKSFYQVLQKEHGGVGAVLLKSFYKAPAGVFVNGSVLIELLSFSLVHKADGRNKFHVDLDALAGMIHLLIRLGDILGIRRFYSGKALLFQETIKAGDRTLIAALHKFDPEDDEPCIGIAPAHIGDEFNLIRGMLVGMMVRSTGSVPEGFDGAVEAVFPAVDILSVGLIASCSIGDTIFVSVVT